MSNSLPQAEFETLLLEEVSNHKKDGIKFAIAGNAGYGKTTTLNVLFDIDMPTSPTQTTTQEIHEVSLILRGAEVKKTIKKDTSLLFYDLPGLGGGEKEEKDVEKYFNLYKELLPTVDVILWVLRADVRAFGLDVEYISRLIKLYPELASHIIIGVNYCDSIAPQDWNTNINNPSTDQENNINDFTDRVNKLIHQQCNIKTSITVPYSAKRAWQLETLFHHLIQATPQGKRWLLADLKPNYRDAFLSHVDPRFRDEIAAIYED